MKHGDKKKGKASKTAGQKSSKASKSKVVKKVVKSVKAKSSASKDSKKAGRPQDTSPSSRGRTSSGDVNFSNPAVAAAFKHAVKKYSNAFRKLTD